LHSEHIQAVVLSSPINLSEAEKLEALQRLDQFRPWLSLDEKRYCLVCGKIITGRKIQVSSGVLGNGPLLLSCPTEGCDSIPFDWVLPTDEIMADLARESAEQSDVSTSPFDRAAGENPIASRLRNFALRFKRSA
jgi:hypothetical protein